MRVDILALDSVFDLGLSAILDVLQTANELIELSGLDVARFEPRVVAVRRAVKTSHGLSVPVRPAGTRALGGLGSVTGNRHAGWGRSD